MEMISASLLQQQDMSLDGGLGSITTENVVAHFCERARGVDARTAHERTKAFYRSSANDWTRALG